DLAGGATTFGFVPRAASFDVERVDRPGDDVEGIGTAHCLRRAAGDDPGDPVGHVRRNMGELGGAVGTELIKEHVQRGVVASGTSPHQPAAVMVDNHDEIAVPPLVGDLVDPDAPQPVEAVNGGVDVCVDPGHDRANR